jgi:RNA-directed DNA polymerase
MSDKRQKNQLELAFTDESRSEAPRVSAEGTESLAAKRGTESLAIGEQLMEEVCERENCKQALARVKANKGSPGVDGMTVHELPEFLKQHWPTIREQLLSGTYKPQPVRRVEIPKPDGGGVRKLGIPSVLDRFIQQAVMQVLQRKWDLTFSDHSYGFRPGRSAHQAVAAAQQYIAAGYRWVVDLDLEKFFDRVNHDKLISKIAERVSDKRLLKLVRAFLRARVMEDGLVSPVDEGTPQGGPMTPRTQKITSNLSAGCRSGVNRVRIDVCHVRLYLYDTWRAPARTRWPSGSIARAICFEMALAFPMPSSSWRRTAPSHRAKPIATCNKLSD